MFLYFAILFGCSQEDKRDVDVTLSQLDKGKQRIEKQIFELKKQNEAFEAHLEQTQEEHKTILNEVELENLDQENQLESLQQRFKEEEKIFQDYLDKLKLENNNPIHVSETPVTSDAQEFKTNLISLYENKKFEELYNALHETEIELSYLRSQKLPQPIAQYLSLREEILSQYLNEDGIIKFLPDSPEFFPVGTLQSDKNSPEGQEIRHQINRGIIAYHTIHGQLAEEDLEKKSLLVTTFGFLREADSTIYEGNAQSARELLHITGSNIDTIIKKK